MSRAEHASGIRWLALPPLPATLLLCGLAVPLVFFGIDRYGVVNADEALYHDIALRMQATGDWFRVATPRYHHVYDTFANAPLQYWMRGVVLSLVGDGMLAMRLASSIAALLAVLATYRAVVHVAGRSAALLAGLLLVTNFQFLFLHSARTGELEPAVCLLLICLAHTFTRCIEDASRSLWPHHLCLALLFNLKAPVIAIPLLAEVACLALLPAARRRIGDWLRLGVMILPLALAWHAFQAWMLRDMLAGVIAEVMSQAAGDGSGDLATRLISHGRYYVAMVYFGAYPSVLLYPLALLAAAASWLRSGDEAPGERVWLVYALATFLFYLSIAKLGPWYVVHAYPFLAALLSLWLVRLAERGGGPLAIGAIACVAALGLWLRPAMAGYNPFAESAIRIAMPITRDALPGLPGWPGAALFAGALCGLLLLLSRRFATGFWPALASALAALVLGVALVRAWQPLAHLDHLSPIASLHADLAERARSGQAIPLPIELPSAHPWIVDHYFLRDYEIVQLRGPEPRGNQAWPPRVLRAKRPERPPGDLRGQSPAAPVTP